MQNHKHTNRLIESSSPYLLQHAHNPVDWYPWGEEALEKAKKEDKPILISIGYAACHWCHVMERESFENDSIAAIMNANYICIKVDREERPDIDQIYMESVQAMGVNGGWPLNVFLTPDQKPFYGGTYFPPETWAKLLRDVDKAYKTDRIKIEESAEKLTGALNQSELLKFGLTTENDDFSLAQLDTIANKIVSKTDPEYGGLNKAPKFPMPSIWNFLMQYHGMNGHKGALTAVENTLDKMGQGGIYDHIGGGFARYSVDGIWHVPHFEKMLYDNGQLLSTYANAYMLTKNENYAQILEETHHWLTTEMQSNEGGFYSSIDADSEGEEGKFYVFTQSEFDSLATEMPEALSSFYNLSKEGNWEHGNNILLKEKWPDAFAEERNLDPIAFKNNLEALNTRLKTYRHTREAPALDDKILSGWNGLVITGLVEAYNATGKDKYLNTALKNANFINNNMMKDGILYRSYKDGKASIPGYLEDYALVIKAFLNVYQANFDAQWLQRAEQLLVYCDANFYDSEELMYFYTSSASKALIARKKEIFDNVIPASNSVMAENLYYMGLLLDNAVYEKRSKKMLAKMTPFLVQEPEYLTQWAQVFLLHTQPTVEIVIVGEDCLEKRKSIASTFIPNKVILGTKSESELPLLANRYAIEGKTTFYICYNKACKLPVFSAQEAIKLIN